MAHLLDNSKGFYGFVSHGAPGWHGLGKTFAEDLTTMQALTESGQDFTVVKLPNQHQLPDDSMLISESSFFTLRLDTNAILGDRLGKGYEVLQNMEVFNLVDEILQSGTGSIETAGSIDGGKKTFLSVKLNKSLTVGDNDTVMQYILFCNAHDGSMSVTATPTNIRVVCMNTLSAALASAQGAIKIRHSKTATDRLYEATRVFKLIEGNEAKNEDTYNRMREMGISPEQFINYIGNVYCTPEEIKAMQSGKSLQNCISTRKFNLIQDVAKFAATGTGMREALTNGKDLNMWAAYNAITGVEARKKYKSFDDRANSMLFGTAAQTIDRAGTLAASPSKIQPLHKIISNSTNLN